MLAIAALTALVLTACSTDADTSPPELDTAAATELQVRAAIRGCVCTGTAVYAPATGDELQEALAEQFSDSIQFLTQDEIDARFAPDATTPAVGKLVDVQGVEATVREDVVAVDVWVTTVADGFHAQTQLFRWDGTTWVDATASGVDVTVTTSVS